MNYAFHPFFAGFFVLIELESSRSVFLFWNLWGTSVPLKWTQVWMGGTSRPCDLRNAANSLRLAFSVSLQVTYRHHLYPPLSPTSLSLILSFSHVLFAPHTPPCLCPPLLPPFSSSCSSSSCPYLPASPSPNVASPAAALTCGRSPPPCSPSPSLPPCPMIKATRLPQQASVIVK